MDKVLAVIVVFAIVGFGYIAYSSEESAKFRVETRKVADSVFDEFEEQISVKIHGGVQIDSPSVVIPVETIEEFKDLIVEHSVDVVYSTSKRSERLKWINVEHYRRVYYVFNEDMTIGYVLNMTANIGGDLSWSWLD